MNYLEDQMRRSSMNQSLNEIKKRQTNMHLGTTLTDANFKSARVVWSKRQVMATLLLGLIAAPNASALGADAPKFSRDIRPILSDKCFNCHGPQEENRQGGFRFDQQESALGEADSGERPIVPGKPEKSELIARITHEDADLRMPPADTNKKLTAEEVELIRQWIASGAEWEEHWAFVAPQRPEPPSFEDSSWPRNAIDSFILARLKKEGLQPSPEADRITLLRRVSFDLTGLPPTPAEVDKFLTDNSLRAYEKAVDRLLNSKRYGEHMARFWLDAARYGDTHGLHLDNYREMWPYRDWVVRALNRNLPYDRFVIQQLAGDLLPDPSLDELVATGFNRCHVTTNEGGSIKEEVHVRNVVDRVVTFGTVFMGMTFECSRCHDHKYDPFTMNDFYSLYAYFNSIDGNPLDGNRKDHAPVTRVPTPLQQSQLKDFDRKIAVVEKRLRDPWPELDELQEIWEEKLRQVELAAIDTSDSNTELPDQPGDVTTDQSETAASIVLGDWYTVGPFSDNRRYLNRRTHGPEGKPVKLDETFKLTNGETAGWVRRATWKDGVVHQDLPGDSAANFLYRRITSPEKQMVKLSLGSDDGIKVFLGEKLVLNKDVERAAAPDQESVELKLEKGVNHLLIKIMNYGGASGFYFALKSGHAAIPEEVITIARTSADARSAKQQRTIQDYFRNKVVESEELDKVRKRLAELRQQRADVDRKIPTTLIWKEAKEPKAAFFLNRGEYDQPGDEVSRRTPLSLPAINPEWPNDRLGLAYWVVDRQNPLTARVAINRFWQQLFGTGLVKTAEDFGSQGEPPSHPELLDWLAVDFIENGWDVKETMKQLAMSATYRQTSRVDPAVYKRDPDNRLLARGPRFRLDGEMLRDQALYVGGLLVEQMGGPSVKPPQPNGLWFAVGYSGSNTVRFKADEGPDKVHRRTLYTFVKRTAPPPQMSTFDGPSREASCVRRERTNTPLQALLLFNDPQFVEAARALAERTLQEAGRSNAERADHMFRICTGRHPDRAELEQLVQAVEDDLQTFQQDEQAAKRLSTVGATPRNEKFSASEVAAWTMQANLLLNLDEVLTKN